MQDATERLKMGWLVQTAEPNGYPLVLNIVNENSDLEATLANSGTIFLTLENDVTLRNRIESMQSLSHIKPQPLFWHS